MGDTKPVRVFHPDRVCALAVMVGFAVGLGILWPWMGLRPDAAALGAYWLWGPPILSAAVGGFLISLSLRTVIPGNLPSRAMLWVSVVVGWMVCGLLYVAVYFESPVLVPDGKVLARGLLCFGMEICLAAPPLFVLLWSARVGIVANPLLATFVGASGAALVGDSVWRLVCQYSHPAHVVTAHGSGMAMVVLLALGIVYLWDRRRART